MGLPSLRQALIITNHSPLAVLDHPIALFFLFAAMASAALFIKSRR